jgi:hypothetical protein
VGMHPENNKWMSRDKLIEMGVEKLVAALDAKEAAAMGLYTRPLTTSVVEKHLIDLGIDPEFGTHSHIRGLSGTFVELLLGIHIVVYLHCSTKASPQNYRCSSLLIVVPILLLVLESYTHMCATCTRPATTYRGSHQTSGVVIVQVARR